MYTPYNKCNTTSAVRQGRCFAPCWGRLVALLLVPCLVADPVTASAFQPSPHIPHVSDLSFNQKRFEEEALILFASGVFVTRSHSFMYSSFCHPMFLARVVWR